MVSGQDIFITGYEKPGGISDPTFYQIGKFWKNGILSDLPGGTKSKEVMQSAMWKGDLYIAASDLDSIYNRVSTFWFKNNEQKILTDGINTSGNISRILLVPKT
jgi:hypothetical protein